MLTRMNPEAFDLEELKEIMILVHNANQSVFALLENLLLWSRMELGALKMNKEILPIDFIINDSIDALRIQAGNKDITIEIEVEKNTQLNIDKNLITTAFRNLLSNAIKFTKKGGKIIISSELSDDKKSIQVHVADNGIGIPENVLNYLFDLDNKYYRKGTAGESSTGLGLLIVKECLDKCGGEVSVSSEIDKGSIFTITLPLKN